MKKYVVFSLRFNRRNKLDKNGKGLIEVRMYHNGKATNHSTGILIMPKEWNFDKGVPKDNGIKRKCDSLIQDLQDFESEFRVKNGRFSLADFQLLNMPQIKVEVKNNSFTKFYTDQLEAEKSLRQSSWRDRELTLEYFNEFCPEVKFDEMDYSLVRRFEYFLQDKKFHINTIAKHHKHIKRYIILAINDNYIFYQNNPYKKFKVNTADSKCQFCTEDELQRLEELIFDKTERMLERCRDMFLMGCYTGLRFGDVYRLKKINFCGQNEDLTLDFKAGKTGKYGTKYLSILFGGKPAEIALKYMPENGNALFKGLTNQKVNKQLKILAKRAKINKPLCFKDSRDTFGTIITQKVSFEIAHGELQHSKAQQTLKYVHKDNVKEKLSNVKW
jgi:integrase